MYTRIIFETAKEFFEACMPGGKVYVPNTVYVVFDGDADPFLSGDGAKKFDLGDITQAEMTREMFHLVGSRVHLT